MRKPWSRLLVLGLLVAPMGASAGETLILHLDPDATSANFELSATLHTVHGYLGPASGQIVFDPADSAAKGEVVIDLAGADTGNGRRDRKMHQKVLETDRYPTSTFQVERIDLPRPLHEGRNDLQLHGELSLHGVTHPVSLPAVVEIDGDRVTATAWVDLPYLEWGVDNPSFFLLRVKKTVRVEIEAAGRIERRTAAATVLGAADEQH